ncbi:MAG: hypothetical protein DHS20C04_26460 [Hyphococcus sp.]|nr:MAG: hypothetical protein DHS20C04_26460 [Marinicaulis sp.]
MLISLAVEAGAFWFGGPASDPGSGFLQNAAAKMHSVSSWGWAGLASLSMAWLWAELASVFYANGRRIKTLLKRSGVEKLVYDTGVHWLVLLRDIRLNQLNDGEKNRLEQELFTKDAPRSFAWHAIWQPIRLALATIIYFVGWLAWTIGTIPEKIVVWSAATHASLETHAAGSFAFLMAPLDAAVLSLPNWLDAAYTIAREQPVLTLALIAGAWFVLSTASRQFANTAAAGVLRLGAWTAFLTGVFAAFATPLFDWLAPIYAAFPHHGLAAVGFIPLTLASAFYFPHLLFWSSWRYAIIRDVESHDATLVTVGGVFNDLQQRVNLQRIVDTDIFQKWWQRIFDIGDIELKDMGGGEPAKVRYVARPHKLLEEIRNAIRESRRHASSSSEFEEGQ